MPVKITLRIDGCTCEIGREVDDGWTVTARDLFPRPCRMIDAKEDGNWRPEIKGIVH